ncbi:phospho-N-acetylmuramoyl-pentapeptide-transferase [Halosquirtibacter xylanolyticus]|uniref:phospho-N-acetylmuramoyl-pentapeptide- transferase n=1 Tax=Halosquirtibacter xylanolyticus TaxID=3374599 RepID=UPI003747C283|nr:phospho-N-acetylmuramoyl-pentapeptide-transferase [Prolixibacteraceae bacterium]
MFYHLFEFLNQYDFPGAGMFQYISFRSSLAVITALLISLIFGKKIIGLLQRQQIGEEIRDLGLQGQMEKKGTPTMGGVIILLSIVVPTLLFADLTNTYILLMLITTVWLGAIGFVDDYIKVFRKNKDGLAGKFKIVGQVSLGLIVAATLYISKDVVVREKVLDSDGQVKKEIVIDQHTGLQKVVNKTVDVKSTKTTIPFIKNHVLDYSSFFSFMGKYKQLAGWALYFLVIIFIITGVSNGANLTDGLDGLATGTSAISGVTFAVLAYVSGNLIFSDYLNIMYIPNIGELTIFISAFIGATIGFLWFNSYPAQVFMGDTGSLSLGGIIAVFAIIIRKELLLPFACGIFMIESLSVMIQVYYFKRTKKKYGEGRRIFLMSPLHHHYQKKEMPESKIVTRFWIVAIILAISTIVTLKVR